MTVHAIARRPIVPTAPRPKKAAASSQAPAPAPATITPDDLSGLQPDTYASLARSFKQKNKQDLADQFTMLAVTNSKSAADAMAYATSRYNPNASSNQAEWNLFGRNDGTYVASPETQIKAVTLAAAKCTTFDEATQALYANPAQSREANTVMIRRAVDLAGDRERVQYMLQQVKDLATPEGIAYAEAAMKTKPQVSWWTRLCRSIDEANN